MKRRGGPQRRVPRKIDFLAKFLTWLDSPECKDAFPNHRDEVISVIETGFPWKAIDDFYRSIDDSRICEAVELLAREVLDDAKDHYETSEKFIRALSSDAELRAAIVDFADSIADDDNRWSVSPEDWHSPDQLSKHSYGTNSIGVLRLAAGVVSVLRDPTIVAALMDTSDAGSGPIRAAQLCVAELLGLAPTTVRRIWKKMGWAVGGVSPRNGP